MPQHEYEPQSFAADRPGWQPTLRGDRTMSLAGGQQTFAANRRRLGADEEAA
jgi:hypothetical protein